MISGSFAKNDLQLKASYGPSPPCTFPDLSHHVCCCEECITQKQMRICPKTKEIESLEIEILFLSNCRTISADAGSASPKNKREFTQKKEIESLEIEILYLPTCRTISAAAGSASPKKKENWSPKKRN